MQIRYPIIMLLPSLLIILAFSLTNGEKSASVLPPEQMADCIAEQAYVNPMPNRFQELVNAISICQEGR